MVSTCAPDVSDTSPPRDALTRSPSFRDCRAQQLARRTLDREHVAPHRRRLLNDDLRRRKLAPAIVGSGARESVTKVRYA